MAATLADKLTNALALKAFDAFYDTMRGNGSAKGSEDRKLLQILESLKSAIANKSERYGWSGGIGSSSIIY